MAKTKDKAPEAAPNITFSKRQILSFVSYSGRADLLAVLLDDNRRYTKAEVKTLLDDFLKRTVK